MPTSTEPVRAATPLECALDRVARLAAAGRDATGGWFQTSEAMPRWLRASTGWTFDPRLRSHEIFNRHESIW